MQELSPGKKLKVIKQYLNGISYDEIAEKTGVGKGTVTNIITALKAGEFPEASTVPEEIEQLRDLAITIKRSNISPVRANIGLSVIERLESLGIEPTDIEKCHTLLQALSTPDLDLKSMVKSVLAVEEVMEETGLSLGELEDKAVGLSQKIEELTPVSEALQEKMNELDSLGDSQKEIEEKVGALTERYNKLKVSTGNLEQKESQLTDRVNGLEERAHAANKQLYEARQDLNTLVKVGMNIEKLGKFTLKLKEVAAHHDIKPDDLYVYLVKELKQLDKGMSFKSIVEENKSALASILKQTAEAAEERKKLTASIDQLRLHKESLEDQAAQFRKQIALDITALSSASKRAIVEIDTVLKSEIEKGISVVHKFNEELSNTLRSELENEITEIHKLNSETLRVGSEIGSMRSTIESLVWIKPLLDLVNGEGNLDDHQVRVIGLRVLKALSSWLNEAHGQDNDIYFMKNHISNAILELEKWRS